MEKKALGVLIEKHGDRHLPMYSQQLNPVAWGYPPCLRAITATTLLVKATKETTVGSPLTIFVAHAVEALLNSHHTQHFSVSHFTSYDIVLLTAAHIILSCNNFNPATLLPSVTDEASHECIMRVNHRLTSHDDLQETPLSNSDF